MAIEFGHLIYSGISIEHLNLKWLYSCDWIIKYRTYLRTYNIKIHWPKFNTYNIISPFAVHVHVHVIVSLSMCPSIYLICVLFMDLCEYAKILGAIKAVNRPNTYQMHTRKWIETQKIKIQLQEGERETFVGFIPWLPPKIAHFPRELAKVHDVYYFDNRFRRSCFCSQGRILYSVLHIHTASIWWCNFKHISKTLNVSHSPYIFKTDW